MSEKNTLRLVFFAFFLSGAAALLYEVVWTRALTFVLGSTVYSLSTLLAAFMAGLAIGAYFGGRLADRGRNLLLYFGLFETGIGLFGLITVPLIYLLPPLYFRLYTAFHLNTDVYYVVQFFLCFLIMLVPTVFMGATFPVVSRRVTLGMEEMGRKVGRAYSMNTFGAIAGSLGAGFLLVPLLGLKWTSFAGGIVNLVVGAAVISVSKPSRRVAVTVAAVLAGALVLGGIFAASSELRYTYATFYESRFYDNFEELSQANRESRIVFRKDYAQGNIIAYEEPDGFISIQQGGKMEGTTTLDVPNTVLLAALPAAALEGPAEDVLVIGLGAGVTTLAAKNISRRVEVAEINPGVVEVVRRFAFPGILDGITLRLTDARKHLLYADRKYDIITSEPSVPTDSAVANLFTREFYEMAARALKDGGVFCQWLPAWAMTFQDAKEVYRTISSVFPHARLWLVTHSTDIIIVGSKEPFRFGREEMEDRAMALARQAVPVDWQDDMKAQGFEFEEIFAFVTLEDKAREWLEDNSARILTDDRPHLEFAMTRNILLGVDVR